MLNPALMRLAWRESARRAGYTALMVLGVALGVAVVVAIDLANESARRAFALSTDAVAGRATHVIVGGPSGVPEAVYRQARAEWGVRSTTPVVEGYGILVEQGGVGVQILGIDPIASASFQTVLPPRMGSLPGFERFYLDPSAVLISSRLAERLGARPGDSLTVQVNDRLASLTVLGILRSPDPLQLAGLDNILLMDVASAQELLGMVGRLTRIDVMATDEVAKGIASRLPPDLRLAPPTEQAEATAQLASAFQLNLSALSLLALVVGMFLIYNTMLFSILRRRTVLGILAALGVSPLQVFVSFLLEAAAVSAVGGLLGLGVGRVLATATVRLTTQTITDFYFLTTVSGVSLDAATALKGLALGIGAGILGAAAPALEAAGVPPVSAMQRSSLELRLRQWLPWLTATGIVFALLGAGLLMLTPQLTANFLGIFAVLLGVALMVP
ncbi:MAG: FtsX-like permease family protein, partial [Chloroflexi bacterium]|nr:FtsX-like permease family protein [Chloroflexota bacterium]